MGKQMVFANKWVFLAPWDTAQILRSGCFVVMILMHCASPLSNRTSSMVFWVRHELCCYNHLFFPQTAFCEQSTRKQTALSQRQRIVFESRIVNWSYQLVITQLVCFKLAAEAIWSATHVEPIRRPRAPGQLGGQSLCAILCNKMGVMDVPL